MSTRRLFFALQPALEQSVKLAAQVAPHVAHSQPVPAQNFHATLCFIGSVDEARLDALRSAAATVRGRRAELLFDTLEHWEKPQVLCATASRESALATALSVAIAEAAVAAGFSPDVKPFRAHLTLARKFRRDLSVEFPQALVPSTVVSCEKFFLMESRRTDEGSIYSALDSWALDD